MDAMVWVICTFHKEADEPGELDFTIPAHNFKPGAGKYFMTAIPNLKFEFFK